MVFPIGVVGVKYPTLKTVFTPFKCSPTPSTDKLLELTLF